MGVSLKILVYLFVLTSVVGITLSTQFNGPNLGVTNIDIAKDKNKRETRVLEMIPLSSDDIKEEEGAIRQREAKDDIKIDDSETQTHQGLDSTVPEISEGSGVSLTQTSVENGAASLKQYVEPESKLTQNSFGSHDASISLAPAKADLNKPLTTVAAEKFKNNQNVPRTPAEDRAEYGRDVETKPEDTSDDKTEITDDFWSFFNENSSTISESSTDTPEQQNSSTISESSTDTPEQQASDSQNETKPDSSQSERQYFDYFSDYSSAGSIADYELGDNDLYSYGSDYDTGNFYDNYDIGDLDNVVDGDNYNTGDVDYGIDNYNQGEGDYEGDNYNDGGNYDLGSEYSNFGDYGDYLLKTQRELEKQIVAAQRDIEAILKQS